MSHSRFDDPSFVCDYWWKHIATADWFHPGKETLVTFALNSKYFLKGWSLVSIGSLDAVIAHPREVFAPAFAVSASAIILAHNHPSGDPQPSMADILTTTKLRDVGRQFDVPLLDHVIVGARHSRHPFASLAEMGCFPGS